MTDWLQTLEMEEYTELFHAAGYWTEADVENLKEIDDTELKRMGIVKMGTYAYYPHRMYRLIHRNYARIIYSFTT